MLKSKQERRYQRLWRNFRKTRASQVWDKYVTHYWSKGWGFTKRIAWKATTGAILVLLPLALEATIEGEAQLQQLNSQLGGAASNPNVQFRPY